MNLLSIENILQDQKNNHDQLNNTKTALKKGNLIYVKLKNRDRIFVSEEFGASLIKQTQTYYGHIGFGHIAAKNTSTSSILF